MSVETTVQYYKDLMLYQHQVQPKATATIALLVRQAICDLLPLAVQNAFDIETAEGAQLDILGKYIGLSRKVAVELDRPYYRYALSESYDPMAPVIGFIDSASSEINAGSVWYKTTYAGESFYTMTDYQYRTMLKLKIVLNNSDNTLKSIDDTLFSFFGTDLVLWDMKDMTLSYAVNPAAQSAITLAYQLGLIPKPQGVGISGIWKNYGTLFAFADASEENGNTTGYADSTIGFNGQHWLDSTDKIL